MSCIRQPYGWIYDCRSLPDYCIKNKKKLPFGLYITNSVQEEIGLRGAQMITERIKPNAAIVTDVTHDTTTPMIDKKKGGGILNSVMDLLLPMHPLFNKI